MNLEQHRLLEKSQLHTAKVAHIDKMARLLSDFRTAAFVYFIGELSPENSVAKLKNEPKRANYYKLESELDSALIVAPFYFGRQTEYWVEQLRNYRTTRSWESAVFDPQFVENLKTLDESEDSLTRTISRAILLDEFDHLTTQVTAAMAWDIASGMENKAELRERWAQLTGDPQVSLSGQCTVEPSKVRVGEVVTLSAGGEKGTGFYSYRWDGDHNLSSRNRVVNVRYHSPGVKIVNVCIYPVRRAAQFEPLFENRIYSQCKVTVLPSEN